MKVKGGYSCHIVRPKIQIYKRIIAIQTKLKMAMKDLLKSNWITTFDSFHLVVIFGVV